MESRRILSGTKEIKQDVALEEVSTTEEILEEVDKLQECKGGGINKLEVLPSMKDNHHHDTIILHEFEDSFKQKENARDERFNFFKFISLTISTWVQHVLLGMPKPISTLTLKDPFHESKLMNFGSMVHVYDWVIEEHQPISIDYQAIQDDDYIKD